VASGGGRPLAITLQLASEGAVALAWLDMGTHRDGWLLTSLLYRCLWSLLGSPSKPKSILGGSSDVIEYSESEPALLSIRSLCSTYYAATNVMW
jgi:hypothetical protein